MNYTERYINKLESCNGGHSRKSLGMIGVSWPPTKGWKKKLIEDDLLNPDDPCPVCGKART